MNREPAIAVVGMGGIFPGAADLAAFWRNILAGVDTARDVPAHRWILDRSRALADGPAPDRVYSLRGCFVDDFVLDPAGLNIEKDLLAALDPLYHLVLHAGRTAFADAATSMLDRRRVGVILAAIALPTDASSAITREILGQAFEERLFAQRELKSSGPSAEPQCDLRTHPLNSRVTGLPAALLAQALRLGGGSYTLDAACASSLYALKLACDELREGRADAMLAGGVSRPECLYTQMGFTQLRALSPSGRCAPFDAACDGLIVGEGAGVVTLKRLDDALRDGDSVHGVIRGIGLSNDIGGSLLAPDSEGQLRAMREAYEQAGWSPDDVDFIECHGTGTPTGDAVEIGSLRTLWEGLNGRTGRCPIGSVKSMIGHLLTGAGAAGLIKVLLAMREQTLPPSANYVGGGRVIPLEGSPFRMQTSPEPWRCRDGSPRRAAVSAFGFGGINAHVLVEEIAPGAPDQSHNRKGSPHDASITKVIGSADTSIAIVGMAAHFGAARSLRQFQETMFEGGATNHKRPDSRWEGSDEIARRLTGERGARGAYLDGSSVPVGKYRLPPTEIPEVLPQQMLMMEVVAAAMEDARLPLRERRPRVGAIIGMALDFGTTNFHLRWWIEGQARHWAERLGFDLDNAELERWIAALKDAAGPALNAARTVGALGGMIASRIAREFQLGGPSYAVSCEEVSGLRAVEIAARALGRGEIDAAIVGAVDLAGDVRNVVTTRLLDPDGDGFVGEGAAAVVLKRLEDAQAAGDRIYAVIRDVGAASDPTADTFSTTMTTGRTGAAEGMASLVKAALCLHYEILPPDDASDSSAYWWRDRVDGPRCAAASATTLDGNNLCVFLEEAEQSAATVRPSFQPTEGTRALFAVEADDAKSLITGIDELAAMVAHGPKNITALARAWLRRRKLSRDRRLAVALVAESMPGLTEALSAARSALSANPDRPLDGRKGAFYNPAPLGRLGQLAFVFPGSGNHYPEMGRDIAFRWPEIVRSLDRESQRLRSQIIDGQSPSDEPDGDADVHRTIFRQVSYCVMMSDLLRQLGIEPQSVIGYSLGESAGLFTLRAWRDRDEMLQRMSRSPLFKTDLAGPCRAIRAAWNIPDDQSVEWTAAVVGRPAEAVRQALDGLKHARLLIVNTPKECVIGGLRTDVATVAGRLRCRAVPLDGVPTVHFEAVRQVEETYRELHLLPTTPPDGIRFYSAAAGRAYDVTRASAAESITAQALHGFDFTALVRHAYADGVRLFVEVGPQASCTRMIGKILTGQPHFARSASSRGESETRDIFQLAAALIAERVPVDVNFLLGKEESADVLGQIVDQPSPQPSPLKGEGAKAVFVEVGRLPSTPPLPARRGREPRLQEAAPRRILEPAALSTGLYEKESLATEWARTTGAAASAHRAFLRFSETAAEGMASVLAFQTRVLETMVGAGMDSGLLTDLFADQSRDRKRALSVSSNAAGRSLTVAALNEPAYSRELCLEFARGSVATVLGTEFAEVDGYPTRVRLPDEPLMLVDRIMEIEGVKGSLTGGRVVTEHDVFADAWYLDGGRTPICITVEAGQADLFLSAYLGIDRITKGLRTYRLLDATVTFHRGLPRPGETIRYDIRIEKFVRQGETYLFFFQFDGTIDGVPVLTMRNGCAGFFLPEEIRNSRGIVLTPEELAPVKGKLSTDWQSLAPMSVESYDDANLAALRRGDLAGCFGPLFAGLPIADPLRLPGGRMKLIDRVTHLDPTGGRYGLGLIRAEADIHPDDWFLKCHFVDDMVMPGTLMYECCAHTLRMFLLRMGWVGEQDEVSYEPVPGVVSSLRCRGPVTPKTKTVTYQVEIKEIGYRPEPYVLADAMMYADGEAIVRMTNMSLQMTGATRERIEEIWARRRGEWCEKGFSHQRGGVPVFSREKILAFCIGNPSDCFGEPFRVFDDERRCARLPGPPYCFMDRVTSVEPKPFVLEPGGWIECEYDVPPDAWYFAANRQPSMPYAVLLEIALQPCGFLAAYAGSALTSQTDLSFRNLGGTAMLHEEIFAKCGTLRTRVRMTDVSRAGGMIIEQFDMEVWRGDRLVFDGKTSFGFFSKASLAQQVGIRDAKERLYLPTAADALAAKRFPLPDEPPDSPSDIPNSEFRIPHWGLPARAFRMIDRIDLLHSDGGPHNLGFIHGSTCVDPSAWFFMAHFYQDPVWPGSLGLESFLQLLKVYAIDCWPEFVATHRFEPIAVGTPHTWAYRGQIIPTNRRVEVQAIITRRADGPSPMLLGNGFLAVDGITIYEMLDFGIRLVP